MAEIRTIICDMCGNHNASEWTFKHKGKKQWVVDLCPLCSKPIVDIQKKGRAPKGASLTPYKKYEATAVTPR